VLARSCLLNHVLVVVIAHGHDENQKGVLVGRLQADAGSGPEEEGSNVESPALSVGWDVFQVVVDDGFDSVDEFLGRELGHEDAVAGGLHAFSVFVWAEDADLAVFVGEQLRKHLNTASPKSVILLAKSGAGKTTAIFDAARLHWCILFTASSSQEDIGKVDPGGFDYSFANLVDFVLPVLDNTTLEDKQKDVDCNRYMNALVISRLVVLFHFQGLSGATPEAWLPADWTSA
jgi:hypothetical protein